MGMADLTRSGYETIHWRACIPPIDPPTTERSFSTWRRSMRCLCASTMSRIVIEGNESAYGLPVSGLTEEGPVEPLHPPITLEQITKYLSVSSPFPGPIMSSHQPGFLSPVWNPAACASPDSACNT